MHQLPRMCHLLLTNSLLSVSHLFLLMTHIASATASSVLAPNNILFLIHGAPSRPGRLLSTPRDTSPSVMLFSATCCISALAKHPNCQDLKSEVCRSTARRQPWPGLAATESGTGGFFSPPERLCRGLATRGGSTRGLEVEPNVSCCTGHEFGTTARAARHDSQESDWLFGPIPFEQPHSISRTNEPTLQCGQQQ